MKLTLHLLFILSSLFSQGILGQEYVVNTDILNVRSHPNTDSEIIGQIRRGDKIQAIGKHADWIKIDYRFKICYVHSEYLKKVGITESTENNKEKINEDNYTFWQGFKKTFIWSSIIVFCGSIMIDQRKRRIKDNRHKGGYRYAPGKWTDTYKFLLYAFIISLPLSLIAGFFSWIL